MSNTSKKSIDLTPKPLMTMSGHEGTIYNIAYLPGGKRVVTCSGDKTIRIWDVENGEQEGTSMDDDSWVVGLAVTRDGKRILSGGNAKGIKVWDVETHELIEEWEGYTDGISCIAMSPDDQLAASGDGKGKIVIREMKEGGQIKHSIKAGKWVNSVSFSSNGKKLASAVDEYEDGRTIYAIRIYDVESGELVLGPIKGHKNIVHCVLWSLDGSQLFSTADDGTIRCWNSETGEPIGQSWTGHTHWVTSSSLSPDGTKLASASYDKHVRLWDAHSGEPIEQPLQHEHELCAVTFSPSGEFVASAGNDNVSIWRVPWWDDSQKQAHDSLLDLPAVPAPKGLSNNQALYQPDFLDLPTTRRPITPTSQPLADPANPTARPVVTRVQHFWRGLVTYRSSSLRPVIELQPIEGRHFWKSPVRVPVTEVAAGRMTDRYAVGRRIRRRKKKEDKPQTHAGTNHTGHCS
ncbi:WD40 repeat-like protein [Gyrodon lividus]|nr:WD40 repeat-like protein [Gyrodon lividus]